MTYSWAKFVVGLALGMVGIWLLSATPSYLFVAVLLLFASTALMTQGSERSVPPEPIAPFTSDMDEWRQLGRDLLAALPSAVLYVVVGLALMLIWDAITSRYPSIAQIPRDVFMPIVLTVWWLPVVIAAYRNGRRRSHHPAS